MIIATGLDVSPLLKLDSVTKACRSKQQSIKEFGLEVGAAALTLGAEFDRLSKGGIEKQLLSCRYVAPHCDLDWKGQLFLTLVLQVDPKHVVGTVLTEKECKVLPFDRGYFGKLQANLEVGDLFIIEPERLHWLLWEDRLNPPGKNFVFLQWIIRDHVLLIPTLKSLSKNYGGHAVKASFKKVYNRAAEVAFDR